MIGHKTAISILAIGFLLSGCATLQGSITAMEGGEYKSYTQAKTKIAALKMADNDAKLTCKNEGGMKYVVTSQEESKNGPEELTTGNKWVDKAISISQIGQDTRDQTDYEVTTLFKCK